jgi:hypothetical protein
VHGDSNSHAWVCASTRLADCALKLFAHVTSFLGPKEIESDELPAFLDHWTGEKTGFYKGVYWQSLGVLQDLSGLSRDEVGLCPPVGVL